MGPKKQEVVYIPIKVIDVPFEEQTKMGIVAAATPKGFTWLKPIEKVYPLTEKELLQFATDFLLDTTGDMFLPNAGELAEEFLKSTTIK